MGPKKIKAARKRKKHSGTPETPQAEPSETHVNPISTLDYLSDESAVTQSQFQGFINLWIVGISVFFICEPVIHYFETGYFLDAQLAHSIFGGTLRLLLLWCQCFCASLGSFFIVRCYEENLFSRLTLRFFQFASHFLTFLYAAAVCVYYKWSICPSGFASILTVIFCMKTHSFIERMLELETGGPSAVARPTLRHFVYYLCCPVLVYEPSYPRGNPFRFSYFIRKLLEMVIAMGAVYVVSMRYIVPVVTECNRPSAVFVGFFKLIWPMLFCFLLTFFILFECICNLLAEITCFGNRDFYHDWWNSTTWDEFARRWNRPVHKFLLKHVYHKSLRDWQLTKASAVVATFLVSAIIHELVMSLCFKRIRLWMFCLMMFQIPLMRIGYIHQGTQVGNWIFWVGMIVGLPLLSVIYGQRCSTVS